MLAIASGERPNRQYESEWEDSESDIESESASQSRVKEEGADQNRNVFDILNRYNEYHGQTLHQSEAEELLVSIKETIGSLFKISNVIREALPRDPYAKALSDKRYHLEEILGIDHVRAQFDLLESEGKNWLVERLGKAITYRQRFLRYAHDHRNNLSTESSENASDPNDAVVTPMQALQLSEPSNQVDEERNDQSPSPFALRVVQSNGSLLRLSPLSDISKGMDKFECPLCWTIQEFEEEALWKEHALFDLRPYVCTFEHCDMKLFSSQRGWFDHELQEHRVSWFCHFCQRDDFEVEDDMRDHLRQRHLLDGKERQIDALAQASRRHEEQIAASSCPFCSDWHKKLRQANPSSEKDGAILVTRTQFREHVGSHMEQLALLTITHGYLEGDGGEETLKQSKTHEGDVLGTSSKSALSREEGDVSVLTDRNNDGTPTENAEREVVDAPVDTQSSLHSTPSRSALASGSVSKSSSSKRPIQELATGTSM